MQRQKRRQCSEYKLFQGIISTSGNIKALLKTILEKAVQLSNADGGQFFLYDDATGMIRLRLTHHPDELKRIILKPGEGIAGKVANDGIARFTNDYFNSPYAVAKLGKPELQRVLKGVMAVPLKWQDKLFGVLVITSKPGSGRIFSNKDVEWLERFSGLASNAVAIARDISWQQTMLDNSPGAIIAVDRQGFITRFNKASEKITGLKKDNIIGQHITNFYYDGKKEAKRINYILFEDSFYKGGPVRRIRTEVRGCNGERIPILIAGAILRDKMGEWIGSMGLIEDLGELECIDQECINRRHFLSMLEQYPQDTPINTQADLRERLTKLMQMTCDFCRNEYIILFAGTGEDDTVLKAIAWVGLPPEVETKLPHFNWLKCEPQPMGYDREITWLRMIDNASNWVSDHEWRHRVRRGIRGNNKDFFKNISCGIPVCLTDKYRAVLVFGPFPARTNLAGETDFIRHIARTINIDALSWLQNLYLKAKNKKAERFGKLIVHRTKMQLQQVITKFGMIKRNTDDESSLKKYAEDGESQVNHLSHVITNALTSHITEMEPEDLDYQPFPLPALIQNCVENFRERVIERGRKIIIDSKIEYLPYAEIDHLMLSLALANLIDNAVKFSFKGTEIIVFSECDNRRVTITVQDRGEQMSGNARDNLIQPGKRHGMSSRARNIPGTGFGLWDASVIAAAHGGKLDFSSVYSRDYNGKPAHLVKVWMTLPLKQGQQQREDCREVKYDR